MIRSSEWAKARHRTRVRKEYLRVESPTTGKTIHFAEREGLNWIQIIHSSGVRVHQYAVMAATLLQMNGMVDRGGVKAVIHVVVDA